MPGRDLFAVLHCGGMQIAVSARDLIEVVSLGGGVTAAPSVPPYVLGLLDLRGVPVPVIDLALLLGRPPSAEPVAMAAVIDHGGYSLAIAAEALGPLVKVEPHEIHPIEQSTGAYPSVLKAILRPPGCGMVQSLDLTALLSAESLLLTRSRSRQVRAATEQRVVYLVFTCADRSFALPALAVQEILDDRPVVHSPFTGGACIGLVRSRGRAIPVIDAGRLLGLPVAGRQARLELVVILTPEGPVALQISHRDDVLAWSPADIVPTAAMGEVRPGLIRGLARKGERDVFILDPEVLAAPDVCALARGHRELFGKLDGSVPEVSAALASPGAEPQRAYLMIEAGITWLVAMDQVAEVMVAPDPADVRGTVSARSAGVLIHRSHSVSLIDLCGLVGMPFGSGGQALVVQAEGQFFGVQVSCVVASVKASLRRAAIRILSTNQSADAALVRRHACFVSWAEGDALRSAVLLDLAALALEIYGGPAAVESPAAVQLMA